MAIPVKDWNSTDTQYDVLKKILRAILSPVVGEHALSTRPFQRDVAPSSFAIQSATGEVFALAAGETGFIRNLGTNPLFYKYGHGATATDFTDVLAAGTVNDDGTGGVVVIQDFAGPVTVNGTSPRYMAWKR